MTHHQKTKLLFGPYHPPKTRRGARLFCELRGNCVVGGFRDGEIPWPYAKRPSHPFIICGDLVRAIKLESRIAVAHHWDAAIGAVRQWRRALGVPAVTTGTRQLYSEIANSRTDDRLERARKKSKTPAAIAKMSKSLKGRVQSPATIEAVRAAAKRPRSEEWKKKMSAFWRKRGHAPGHPESRIWTAREEALLGKVPDAVIAERFGRTEEAVQSRRWKLRIKKFRAAGG